MSIYIKGMKMPTGDSMIVAIRPDGMVEDVMGCYVGKAVPVPPHGRLVDLDELFKQVTMDEHFSALEAMYVQSLISNAPTIIPADEV